ncbi:MAG: methylmalonyl-CoA mutase family protein [Flavobacteriales bacterium]
MAWPAWWARRCAYNNLLRATTQSMSAILGGAMHVEALPYDYYTGNPTAHGYRMGRNILQLLIEEGRIHEMVNAADGAYYIETLTEQLAEKSWAIFQSWDNGSMEEVRAQYHDASSEWMKSEKERIEAGNKVIVGVNRYANQLVDLSDTKTTLRVS